MKKTRSGFTIVELLIVIVVIGILAAITIVAYNGFQTRAENAKTIAGVNQAVKLMKAYKAVNGSYPTSSTYWNCLGTGYPSNVCVTALNGSTIVANSSSFDSSLSSFGSLPQLSTKSMVINPDGNYMGAYWQADAGMVWYYLNGASQTCSSGGTGYNYGNVTECRLTLE